MNPEPPVSQRLIQLVQFRKMINRRRWYLSISFLFLYGLFDLAMLLFLRSNILAAFSISFLVLCMMTLLVVLRTSYQLNTLIAKAEEIETERLSEAALSNKLEGVQVTVRAVAHTMNQPLTAALGYLALYADTNPIERDERDLEYIRQEIERVSTLVRQFQQVASYQTIPYADGNSMLDLYDSRASANSLYQ